MQFVCASDSLYICISVDSKLCPVFGSLSLLIFPLRQTLIEETHPATNY